MAYSAGGLIQATDYNGFISTTADANVNGIWGTGSSDRGYGQSARATVAAAGTVTAAQWATLVNTISTMASHQSTTITSRTAPTTGDLITILSNLNTDLATLTTRRGFAVASGTEIVAFTGTTSKTTATGSGSTAWTITFTHTITFANANAARYFWNAGGIARIRFRKNSTGQLADAEWNDLANTLTGDIRITGRVAGAAQTIAGTSYTGTTKIGGTGTPNILLTTTGWYNLTTSNTNIYKQFADTAPYTGQFINVAAKTAGSGTQLVITTTWTDPGGSAVGSSDVISGGTATASPFSTFGTAPTTLVTLLPPSTSSGLSASWGTPTIAATVA
jgi:hypothetical protein